MKMTKIRSRYISFREMEKKKIYACIKGFVEYFVFIQLCATSDDEKLI